MAGDELERVPSAESAGVLPADLVDHLVGAARTLALRQQRLGRIRPKRVRVRIIGLKGEDVLADLLMELQGGGVGDETCEGVLSENL